MKLTKQIARQMFLIRAFEEKLEDFFNRGLMRGTTHGSIGQELVPAALMQLLDRESDYIFATHRCHGYYLAYTEDPYTLAAEMMGKRDGPVFGAGGSQHIRRDNFYTNGITGGMVPEAVGVALGLQRNKKAGIAVAIMGDGGFNEGYVQEGLNLAAVYQVPVLFVLENNRYAMSTRSSTYTAGSIKERVHSYHIPYYCASTSKAADLLQTMETAVFAVKNNRTPAFIEIDTFRMCGHSKSDECAYMDAAERQFYVEHDPLGHMQTYGIENAEELRKQADQQVGLAFEKAARCEEISLPEFERQLEGGRGI